VAVLHRAFFVLKSATTLDEENRPTTVRAKKTISRRRIIIVLLLSSTMMAVGLLVRSMVAVNSTKLLREARLELIHGNYAVAEKLALEASIDSNQSPWALLVAAEAAVRLNRPDDAFKYYEQVPLDLGEASISAGFGAAEMLCHLGRLSDSEARLRNVLAKDPQHTLSHQRLALILNITGRRWEATQHLLHVIQKLPGDTEPLLLLGSSERMVDAGPLLELCRQIAPNDPLPVLGDARRALAVNRIVEARSLMEKIMPRLPLEAELQARWGQLLSDSDSITAFVAWNNNLPAGIDAHPEIWMARASFALNLGQKSVAARCFWETLKRDPEHRAAHYKLGKVLTELGEPALAAPFQERAERLQQLALVLDDLFHHPSELELMSRASALTESLGRIPEAYGWATAAIKLNPNTIWATDRVRRLKPLRPELLRQTLKETNLAEYVDLSRFPLPDAVTMRDTAPLSAANSPMLLGSVRFSDDTAAAGLNFEYFNSSDPLTPGARIFETTGGGVGVIDFDADSWPDLCLTQGCVWPPIAGSKVYLDQLFRNEQGTRFRTVTDPAGLHDADFGQGVSSGDFDNDGFPDLYIGNFGRNRLFRNNGDGTFADVTDSSGIKSALWTTSCMIADINADGIPDLYDVNYADGPKVETLICERQGKWRSCSPRAFDAAPDQLWLGAGDGNFRNITDESGIHVSGGFGLGIVAADFRATGKLDLFVANDEVPNFFFVQQNQDNPAVVFSELAMTSGVAVDSDGASQGCMGIAVDDVDGDGLTDLFVTNFYHESNTLYRQLTPGLFVDETRRAELRDPGFAMLGFGTQFIDGELDGWPDLVVTNGHIDDLSDLGEPFQMPPQYYRNKGGGRFVEVPSSETGPFFEGRYVGRGLARLDWNRDGLEDFAISHIGSPAALVTNTTSPHGHFLCLRLYGKTCSRDAIATTVELVCGERRIVRRLYGGDGYQACNQRILTFGLGSIEQIDSLKILWPDGKVENRMGIIPDQFLMIVQGRNGVNSLPE